MIDPHNEDCPSNDFNQGDPGGSCWGDGHYRCKECIHYRKDFKMFGQDFIDYVHAIQSGLQIISIGAAYEPIVTQMKLPL